eukprot:TRINITY_DN9945_c0_g1_i1.p1 TRINITY_DN9945_c0_g1~~TRINITY_DN9945_c0_g1_i1.p1  ORF type:complete len:207 (+),score=8.71 TRINITY_DN9945_c0_g1_i1:60-680(+)
MYNNAGLLTPGLTIQQFLPTAIILAVFDLINLTLGWFLSVYFLAILAGFTIGLVLRLVFIVKRRFPYLFQSATHVQGMVTNTSPLLPTGPAPTETIDIMQVVVYDENMVILVPKTIHLVYWSYILSSVVSSLTALVAMIITVALIGSDPFHEHDSLVTVLVYVFIACCGFCAINVGCLLAFYFILRHSKVAIVQRYAAVAFGKQVE